MTQHSLVEPCCRCYGAHRPFVNFEVILNTYNSLCFSCTVGTGTAASLTRAQGPLRLSYALKSNVCRRTKSIYERQALVRGRHKQHRQPTPTRSQERPVRQPSRALPALHSSGTPQPRPGGVAPHSSGCTEVSVSRHGRAGNDALQPLLPLNSGHDSCIDPLTFIYAGS